MRITSLEVAIRTRSLVGMLHWMILGSEKEIFGRFQTSRLTLDSSGLLVVSYPWDGG